MDGLAPPGGNGDCTMKVGDLVKITRPRIGCQINSLGLVIRAYTVSFPGSKAHDNYPVCEVFMFSGEHIRRFLPRDLEVLEATTL